MESKEEILREYCRRGWRILPTWHVVEVNGVRQCACQRGAECKKAGKHPRIRAWQRQATCDFRLVQTMHRSWPEANWGWIQDNTFTIDIDAHRDGFRSLEEWENYNGGPIATLTQYTPNGGVHLVYRQPENAFPQLGDFMPGVEIRGTGSYILIAPAQGLLGPYKWKDASAPISECDGETLEVIYGCLRQAGKNPKLIDGTSSSDLPATELFLERGFGFHTGSRNSDAYRLAWRLLALSEYKPSTWPFEQVFRTMRAIWEMTVQGEHAFEWSECVACLRSAYERRLKQQREQNAIDAQRLALLVKNK